MVSVYAYYEDGKDVKHSHITKITYASSGKAVNVPEEDLIKHLFPFGQPLWLHSNYGISIISGNGLRFIDIKQE